MFTKFAVALLAPFAIAKGNNDGTSQENAVTYTVTLDDGSNDATIDVNLYNARAVTGTDADGVPAFVYELHGDLDIDSSEISLRFAYGFCLRPSVEAGSENTNDWDCLTVRVVLSDSSAPNYEVHDNWIPAATLSSSTSPVGNSVYDSLNDFNMISNKNQNGTQGQGGSSTTVSLSDFGTHWKRNFATSDAQDH